MKDCKNCGKPLIRKRFNGRLEDKGVFNRRKFCGRSCMRQGMMKEDPTVSALRKRSNKLAGPVCEGENCQTVGRVQPLSVHHMDGDIRNNVSSNLKTFCESCHQKWHWKNGKQPWKRRAACKVCPSLSRRLGLCSKHYQRFKKYGDPLLMKKRVGLVYVLQRDPTIPYGSGSIIDDIYHQPASDG